MEHTTHTCYKTYLNYLGKKGNTPRERSLTQSAEDFRRLVVDNPNYVEDCKRNGEPQSFMITRSDVLYRANITAFPGEDLFPGDMIEAFGEHWICYQTRVANPLQTTGIIWLCNHLFRWQNNSPEIIERWGVLDSGVFSTTKTAGYEVNTPDVQYKIYLPLDDDTIRLYVDKRIATNVRYDANGKEILEVYKLTRVDPTSQAYGQGAHLMLLNARSDDYIAEHDNIEMRICGYIPPEPIVDSLPVDELIDSTISGRPTIRVGASRLYTTNIPNEAEPIWNVMPNNAGVSIALEDSGCRLSVEDRGSLVGEMLTLSVSDSAGKYNVAEFTVEVIS